MSAPFLTRRLAAEHVTSQGVKTTEQGLADKASRGGGPKYSIINGRAVYTKTDLDAWIAEQAARPVVRRSKRRRAGEAA